jgi:hypothetical protein
VEFFPLLVLVIMGVEEVILENTYVGLLSSFSFVIEHEALTS